jgi:hypothetical protein
MASDDAVFREEDRLPWLETVEPDEPDGPPLGRVFAAVLLGLAALAAIIFGVYKLQHRQPAAEGELIAAQEGDYKIKPDEPGGLKVKGEGTQAVATSNGKPGSGAIDLKAVPEAPVNGKRAQPIPAKESEGGRNAVAQVPAAAAKLTAKPPVAAPAAHAPGAATGGSLVQLGAYPTEAVANAQWTSFTKRFAYLAPLGKSIQPVASGGKTLYRLRVNAGGANQAADICGRLKVAGEDCFVTAG